MVFQRSALFEWMDVRKNIGFCPSMKAPRPGRIHKEYRLPFAELGVGEDLREVKKHGDFNATCEEILSMIWDMEEEIMGRSETAA